MPRSIWATLIESFQLSNDDIYQKIGFPASKLGKLAKIQPFEPNFEAGLLQQGPEIMPRSIWATLVESFQLSKKDIYQKISFPASKLAKLAKIQPFEPNFEAGLLQQVPEIMPRSIWAKLIESFQLSKNDIYQKIGFPASKLAQIQPYQPNFEAGLLKQPIEIIWAETHKVTQNDPMGTKLIHPKNGIDSSTHLQGIDSNSQCSGLSPYPLRPQICHIHSTC